jgi:peptidyl-prolyl cis-trans isomerase C
MNARQATLSTVRQLLTQRATELGLLTPEHTETEADAAIERLLDREVVTPEATDEECSRYYALHPERFSSGDLVFARHILLAITPGAPIALIRAQAEKVLDEARAEPSRFAELARRHSNCPSGERDGNLGQLSGGECVPEFEQELFEGRATGVLPHLVKTRFGFHIVAIDQRVAGRLVPYEAAREQVAAHLYAAVQETALKQYVQILAGRAGVELPGTETPTSPLVQ